MRSSDKEYTIDELFDQYVDIDQFDLSDQAMEPSSSDDLNNLFDFPGSSNGSEGLETSPMPDWEARNNQLEEPWQQLLHYLQQDEALPPIQGKNLVYPQSYGRAVASDPEIFSLGTCSPQILDTTPSSSPASPSPSASHQRRKITTTIKNAILRKNLTPIFKAVRRRSVSPRMMRSSHYREGQNTIWSRRMEAAADQLNLDIPQKRFPDSPPPSGKPRHNGFNNGISSSGHAVSLPSELVPLDAGLISTPECFSQLHNSNMTPLTTPVMEQRRFSSNDFLGASSSNNSRYLNLPENSQNEALSALQTPPSSTQLPMASWGQAPNESLDFTFPASPTFNAPKSHLWFLTNEPPQPSQPKYHSCPPDMMALPIDTITSIDLATNGLMIQCEPSAISSTRMSSFTASSPLYSPDTYLISPPLMSGPMMPMQHHRSHSQLSPPPRSPSASPPPISSRSRRESSMKRRSLQHHRRKSVASHGDSSAHRGGSGVGFVNFTPEDSKKILTGVAPSGSSKTKARREKEAAERRRKMSEAARKAIIAAGGDPGTLEREGLLTS
ncbi:hypothetical protein M501DRAFT_1002282 [Patellaria atrata CBS 101060]|uniref:Developmental regulatory protein wetA n=1 Tax=Patellaria atrata CBS 101060 TaxID=1346257 RepID=A0A9P4SC90_9PEZI|nr:hypothetical protein M501DRAFT_1002282 [Patellaria atrata CBS 101060]